MNQSNNISILPFYRSIDEQDSRRNYAYGEKYPLYTPLGSVPPFQIVRRHNSATVTAATLFRTDRTMQADILASLQSAGLKVRQYADYNYDIVVFPSLGQMNITTEEGMYYIRLRMSDSTLYYSDIFTVSAITSGCLMLQWWDMSDLIMDGGRIAYVNSIDEVDYRNTLWLNTQLGKPDYEFEEQGETRDGYFFPEKMISEKVYKCNFLAPEYLCDVMRLIRLSDNVVVVDQYGNNYRCDTFLCTPKWQEQGNLANVEVEFTCDTVVKKIGRGYAVDDSADFNNDFNNDFDVVTVENE
jgi:hypothetical protein